MGDNRDGTYTAQLRPVKAGLLTLSALVNGELVGLPQTLAVAPGPLARLAPAQELLPHCTAGLRADSACALSVSGSHCAIKVYIQGAPLKAD